MKKSRIISLLACSMLCFAAGWTGRNLACLQRAPDSSLVLSTETPVSPRPSPVPVTGSTLPAGSFEIHKDLTGRLLRQAAARCSTAALWDLVFLQGGSNEDIDLIAHELVDREGVAAVRKILASGDDLLGSLGGYFLAAYAEKDLEAALEIYRSQESFTFSWEECRRVLVNAAIATSASRLIETVGVIEAHPAPPANFCGRTSYPPGFDFRMVLDYLAAHSGRLSVPDDLTVAWASRDPAAALDWVHDHPGFNYSHPVLEANYSPPPDLNRIQTHQAIAEAPEPIRAQAFVRLAQYSQQDRDQAWKDMGSASAKVDPALLAAAGSMGSDPAYLEAVINQTTYEDNPDSSWAKVSQEQREAAIATRLATWTSYDPTPKGEKARAFWLANFRRVCGE
jgi:hypothetical protein